MLRVNAEMLLGMLLAPLLLCTPKSWDRPLLYQSTTYLDEVLMAPRVAELVGLPCVIHCQQGDVVSLRLEELGTLLVRLLISIRDSSSSTGRDD